MKNITDWEDGFKPMEDSFPDIRTASPDNVRLHRSNLLRTHPSVFLNSRPALKKIDVLLDGRWIYYIPIDEFQTVHDTLDWVRQVADKRWATTQTISELCSILILALARGVRNAD